MSLKEDVRIIAATNKNLAELAKKGQFREDLFYRLHVIPIHIPPLRERKSDIVILGEFFLRKFCQVMNRSHLHFSYQAIQSLQSYQWPGNVRELQNVIERTVYLCPEEVTEIDHIELEADAVSPFPKEDTTNVAPAVGSYKVQMEAYERVLLQNALQTYKTARKTALHLGLSHTAVLNKIKKYHLQPPL